MLPSTVVHEYVFAMGFDMSGKQRRSEDNHTMFSQWPLFIFGFPFNKSGLRTVNSNLFEIYLIIIREFILRYISLHAEKSSRSSEGKFYLWYIYTERMKTYLRFLAALPLMKRRRWC